jgi:hypothetical protein
MALPVKKTPATPNRAEVAEAGAEVLGQAVTGGSGGTGGAGRVGEVFRSRPEPDQGYERRRREVTGGVERHDGPEPGDRDQRPAQRPADQPDRPADQLPERVRGAEFRTAPDELRDQRPLSRSEVLPERRLQRERGVDDPYLVPGVHEHQEQHGAGPQQIGGDHRPAPVPAVGVDAGDRAQQHRRHGLGGHGQARRHRRAGQPEDEERRGDQQEPGADHGQELAGEQEAEVADAEGAEHARTVRRARGRRAGVIEC